VRVPIAYVRAIYARATGQGMAFEATPAPLAEPPAPLAPRALPAPAGAAPPPQPLRILPAPDSEGPPPDPPAGGSPGERPRLTRVK
jgi:hypothetical protein